MNHETQSGELEPNISFGTEQSELHSAFTGCTVYLNNQRIGHILVGETKPENQKFSFIPDSNMNLGTLTPESIISIYKKTLTK